MPVCRETDRCIYMNPGSISIPKEDSLHSYMILDEKFEWKDLDGEVYMEKEIRWKRKESCLG